jgi:glycosyltransferase involved in cell wall biosynthesis
MAAIRLALVMIVRDEERSLARCLNSLHEAVDQIVILDTGSTDGTIEIARRYGAEVHHFDWCDDFAAARNAALEHSRADWNLMLDADEWLVGGLASLGPATIPPLRGGPAKFCGCIQIADEGEPEARRRSFIPRLLPRGVRYRGRVHEQPVTGLPLVRLPVLVLHDGYSAEHLKRKEGRNVSLLRQEIDIRPDDPYLLYQLGRQYLTMGDNAAAADCLTVAREKSSAEDATRHSIIIYLLLALRWCERFDEALGIIDAEQDNWENSPDFYFAVAEVYLEWISRNVDLATDLLPVVECAWLKCLQIGENPDLDGSVEGSGSFRPAANLANLYAKLGDTERAAHFRQAASAMRGMAAAA